MSRVLTHSGAARSSVRPAWRLRAAIFGALLSLLAVLSINLLTAWHSSIGDTGPVHADAVQHVAKGVGQTDPDDPIHVAAHAAGQWLIAPISAAGSILVTAVEVLWRTYDAELAPGRGPPAILEPPRR